MIALPNLDPPERCNTLRGCYVVDCAGAHVYASTLDSGTVLRVDGEIDASNANFVVGAVRRFSPPTAPLILDLTRLDFLGMAGLRALLGLYREHQHAHLHFIVVAGAVLRRLMRIFTDLAVPVAESVPEALQLIDDARPARRQFVSGATVVGDHFQVHANRDGGIVGRHRRRGRHLPMSDPTTPKTYGGTGELRPQDTAE